jgi:hypothetical protein
MCRKFFALLAVLLAFAGLSAPRAEAKDAKKAAPAQTTTQPQGTPPAAPPAAAMAPLPPGAMPKMPDQYKLNLLIRTTIIAINQANKTGNYTVLRDLAAPDFQNVNSAEKLAEIFTGLRNSKFDLSPAGLSGGPNNSWRSWRALYRGHEQLPCRDYGFARSYRQTTVSNPR